MDIIKGVKIGILSLIRNKLDFFWNTFFPIFLLTIMIITFRGLGKNFEPIKIGMKNTNKYIQFVKEIKYLDIKETSDDILKDLKDKKYVAFVDENLNLEITRNGSDIITVKNIFENLKQISTTNLNREEIIKNFSKELVDYSEQKSDRFSVFVYSVLIMTSLYTGFSTIEATSNVILNHTFVSIRLLTSPLKKYKYILSTIISSVIISLINISILLLYLKFIMRINSIKNYPLTYIVLIVAMVFGAVIGIFITLYIKTSFKNKGNILLGTILFMNYTSGLAGVNIVGIVENNVPILAKINPTSYLNNALVAINEINNFTTVKTGLIYVIILTFIIGVLSVIKLRRIHNVF